MTPEEIGAMAACEMVVAHSPALAARTLFRHQRECPERLDRIMSENERLREGIRDALAYLRTGTNTEQAIAWLDRLAFDDQGERP